MKGLEIAHECVRKEMASFPNVRPLAESPDMSEGVRMSAVLLLAGSAAHLPAAVNTAVASSELATLRGSQAVCFTRVRPTRDPGTSQSPASLVGTPSYAERSRS